MGIPISASCPPAQRRTHKTITMTQDAKPRLRGFALNQNTVRLYLYVRTYYVRSRSGFFHW
ncbi:hypothetical protein F2N28_26520 [Escherichia coli]|nr:hypothetical protein [Escherichia coli]EFE8014317.1 hypothetical protein [Escherichia coli]